MQDIDTIIDEERDEINPRIVLEHVRAHDKRMRNGREDWALAKASYMTQYWRHMRGNPVSAYSNKTHDIDIEVNRLWGMLSSYLSALYPRAARAVVSPDAAGTGDPEKAELVANSWLGSRRIHQRITSALRQSLLYPGAGVKVGYHPGRGSALDRVWVRVIPWWEMVLDQDVGDAEDERFRGHIYYRSKHEVEEEYGLENLTGIGREDFLSGRLSDTKSKQRDKYSERAESDNQAFVRVLEICNLKDTIRDRDDPSIEYQGRLEIYVLGQGAVSNKPVFAGPLPFARPDGRPMAHVVPLIFNHEPEFPLRGIAHSARILPQVRELNSYRSFMAMATRKDTRQYITRKGTFNAEELTGLTEGQDGLVLEVSSDFERPLDDAIRPVMNGPLTANIQNHMSMVENDLERVIGGSPQARGQITKATAFEVQTVQQYTESEFGMHGLVKDEWLAEMIRVVLRAIMSAMQDLGDSAGGYEDESDLKLAEVGAEIDEDNEVKDEDRVQAKPKIVEGEDIEEAEELEEGEEPSDSAEKVMREGGADDSAGTSKAGTSKAGVKSKIMDMISKISGKQTSMSDDDLTPELGSSITDDNSAEISYAALKLRNRNEFVDVHPFDLDGDFEINFVEGGRTPVNDAAMQQNLVGLLQPYTALWEASQQPDAMGTFARNYLKVIAERFDMPRDLHPDELEVQAEERQQEAEEKAKEEGEKPQEQPPAQPAGAPPPGVPAGPGGAPVGPPVAAPGAPGAPPMGPPGQPGIQGPPPGAEMGMPSAGPGMMPSGAGEQELQQLIAEIMQMPPEEALAMLESLFARQPQMLELVAQIRQLPPEQQAAAIAELLEGVLSAGV